jgi:molybdopterin-guanine dinucleotide biosynthesis protein A
LHGGLNGQMMLVIPADMPWLHPEILERLYKAAGNVEAVAYAGEVFPLLIRATSRVSGFISNGLENETPRQNRKATPGFSMKAILSGLDTLLLDCKDMDNRTFSNLNTPEDWLAYKKHKK